MQLRTIIRTPMATTTSITQVAISSAIPFVVKMETDRIGMAAATHSTIPMVSWV